MKLIFALGNAEKQYDGTRHNVGFWVADELAGKYGASYKDRSKFKCDLAETTVEGQKVLIAKPTTYYNEVGQSYRALADFYKIAPEDTLIIHDDLALDFGTLRTRVGGSDAGNNGIKSINAHGGNATHRLRIGIATDRRAIMGDTDFVLGAFSPSERTALAALQPKIEQCVDEFVSGVLSPTTHRAA